MCERSGMALFRRCCHVVFDFGVRRRLVLEADVEVVFFVLVVEGPRLVSTTQDMSCTIALLLLLATPAHSLGAAGSVAHVAAATGGGAKKSTWTNPTAPPKCCEGQAVGLNLSIPTTCPAYNSSDNATSDGKWRTTQDAACPAARPLCVRIKCINILFQGCNTSEGVDALLSQLNLTCEDITEYVEEGNTNLAASDGLSAVTIACIVIGSVFGVAMLVFCACVYKEAGKFRGNTVSQHAIH